MVEATTAAGLAAKSLTNDELLTRIAAFREEDELVQYGLHFLEQEALDRMERNGATAIPSEKYICELQRKDTYDQAGFTPLLEVFNESDLGEVYTPEHQETITVAPKWNTVKLIAKARRYGDKALAVVERAKIPGRPSLKFQEKP